MPRLWHFSRIWARGLRLAGAAMALWLGACGTLEMTPEERRQVGRILNSRREASRAAWRHQRIGNSSAFDYALHRTAILLPKPMQAHIVKKGQKGPYAVRMRSRDGSVVFGCAAAVSADGYFLTAAHCVEDGPLQLVVWKHERPVTVPARLVWSGHGPGKDRADLALVKADFRPDHYFSLVDDVTVHRGLAVLTSGFGELRPTQSGGHVRQVGRWQHSDGARWRELQHDAPTAPGDSGGPLLDAEGHLLGINSLIAAVPLLSHNQVWFYKATACQPDPAWLRSLIERDRAAHAGRTTPRTPG